MPRAQTATALDEDLIEDRDLPSAILPYRLDKREMRPASPAKSTQADTVTLLCPLRTIVDQVDAEKPARREHLYNGLQRGGQISLAHERLQDSIRSHHEMKAGVQSERQRANVAADERHTTHCAGTAEPTPSI